MSATRCSDINDRLPSFREIVGQVRADYEKGHFDETPFDFAHYMEGMQPTGLTEDGTVVIPPSYNPLDGPLVLATQPKEKGRVVHLPNGNSYERQAAERIAAQAGLPAAVPEHLLRASHSIDRYATGVINNVIGITPHNPTQSARPILLPRLMVLDGKNLKATDMVTPSVGHEMDHWDFYLNQAGAIQSQQGPSTVQWLRALGEKRAYRTSYAIERSLGHHALTPSVEDVVRAHAATEPHNAHRIFNQITPHLQRRGMFRRRGSAGSLSALAIEQLFGNPQLPVTSEELQAMSAVGHI
jgi:hypothetical protein